MVVAGVVGLVLGVASAVVVVLAALGLLAGSVGGYVCLSLCAVGFGAAGVALLAGSRVMPRGWPPRSGESGSAPEAAQSGSAPEAAQSGSASEAAVSGESGSAPERAAPGGAVPEGRASGDVDAAPDGPAAGAEDENGPAR
ncbi:hypothetical protein Athai_63540 [Actinocatenispora thailandica]|uniref:Uncharacterized protein n=1 Tax=Actinocatenispora thailandica TaxID=227318 RepID=A0A7R7DVZ0_9ACTN|nr:hypothetical protein [Actinocatenispora thailandica]BCJ38851.1 hypothetical protein Athai_63540 [Actinocatenispora thailandica]